MLLTGQAQRGNMRSPSQNIAVSRLGRHRWSNFLTYPAITTSHHGRLRVGTRAVRAPGMRSSNRRAACDLGTRVGTSCSFSLDMSRLHIIASSLLGSPFGLVIKTTDILTHVGNGEQRVRLMKPHRQACFLAGDR